MTPATVTVGAVLAGAGAVTLTVNVAGARSNVPLVLFDVWLTLIVAEPAATGATVSVCVSPQDVKVTELGLTVATAVLLDVTERPSVVLPVRLQPFLPSPPGALRRVASSRWPHLR